MKLREFDLYFNADMSEASIYTNTEPWTENCHWAKPDAHVREVDPNEPDYKAIAEGLMGALKATLDNFCGSGTCRCCMEKADILNEAIEAARQKGMK